MQKDSQDGASYGCMMPFLLSILVVIVLSNFTKAVGYALFALVGLFPIYRMVRVVVAGRAIPLAEWFVTFLVGASAATVSAVTLPDLQLTEKEQMRLMAVVVALSFVSAFAGSAFAWYYVSSIDEQDPRRRWRVLFAGWVLAVGSWVGLFAYYAAKAK